jgi:hypothetical protein
MLVLSLNGPFFNFLPFIIPNFDIYNIKPEGVQEGSYRGVDNGLEINVKSQNKIRNFMKFSRGGNFMEI